MSRPNFFIVGAPKCGTTSVYDYLRNHRNVFLPRIKEPHYFATDFDSYRTLRKEEDYLDLYMGAKPHHTACGDASVFYLYSREAVPNILQFDPAARFVVMLRNPVELAYSLHSQYLYTFYEDEKDFEKAWALQEVRRAGKCVPKHCVEPAFLQYAAVGRLGEQVSRLMSQVGRAQVLFFLFEDLHESPRKVTAELLQFLDLPTDGRQDFPISNQNRTHRSEPLARFLMRPPFPLNVLKNGMKKVFNLQDTAIGHRIYRYNQVLVPRTPLSPATREALTRTFSADIELLQDLIGRDLRHWRESAPRVSART
jgi:hypothetical protein